METLRVIAKIGAPCPREGRPRDYIDDSVPVDVPNTAYYRRRVADGSLLTAAKAAPELAIEEPERPAKAKRQAARQ